MKDTALLAALYETVGNPGAWVPFLQELTRNSFFDRATLSLHDAAHNWADASIQVGFDSDFAATYAAHYAAVNPWVPRGGGRRRVGEVLTSEVEVPFVELQRTEFYTDFCRPLRMDVAIGLPVQQDGARAMVVTAVGLRANLDREPHLFRRLHLVAPHLLRVAQVNRLFGALEARFAATEAGLEGMAIAMLLVNAGGRVVYLNPAAKRMISDADGILLTRQVIDASLPGEGQALRQLVAGALMCFGDMAAAPGGVMRISRASGATPYEVLVAPISAATIRLGFHGPLAVVFVRDPAANAGVPLARLQALYCLTRAEARLMQALLGGDTLQEIGERFGVTRETLRTQLKSLFQKTGSRSQLDLLRLGLRGLAVFGTQKA